MSRKPIRQRSGAYGQIPACAFDDIALTPALIVTLGCIATYSSAKQGRWCYPAQGTMALRLGVCRDTISRHIKQLVKLGYLESRPDYRNDGGRTSNLYRLVMDFDLPISRYRVPPEDIEEIADSDMAEPTTPASPPVGPRSDRGTPPVGPRSDRDVGPRSDRDVGPRSDRDVGPRSDSSEQTQLTDQLTDQRTGPPPIKKMERAEPEAQGGPTWGEMSGWCRTREGRAAMAVIDARYTSGFMPRAADMVAAWNAVHPYRVWGTPPNRIVEGSLVDSARAGVG